MKKISKEGFGDENGTYDALGRSPYTGYVAAFMVAAGIVGLAAAIAYDQGWFHSAPGGASIVTPLGQSKAPAAP